MAVDARHVVRRLAELRDWAEYVHDSLTRDQPYEAGKLERLSELADPEELRELRESSRRLARRLSAVLARVAVETARQRNGPSDSLPHPPANQTVRFAGPLRR